MNASSDYAGQLASLPNLLPRDYFRGIRARMLCTADNIVAFLRTEKGLLQRRSFDSRPHHRHVLLICFETAGAINVDGSVFHLQPGQAFLVKPYQFHFYMEIERDAVTWLFLTFETRDPAPYESFANTPVALGPELLQDAVSIAQRFSERDTASEADQDMLVLATATLLNQIRALALTQSAPLIRPRPTPPVGYSLVDRINLLLDRRLEDSISIPRIAATLSLSESHLRKRFRALTGLSLGSYLVHYKLSRAVKLLVHSQSSLTQIALECGYESLAAFSRSFKTKLGVSPSQYRKAAAFAPEATEPP